MIYKVGILGATGKMGQEVSALMHAGFTQKGDTLEFCDAVARSKKITYVDGVPVRTLAEKPFEPAHVWIDFSRPDATLGLLESTKEPVVICTTGFSFQEKERIETEAKKRAILIAANTSPGINLVLSMLEALPTVSKLGFDISIEEVHHTQKVDKPSGTAKILNQTLEMRGNHVQEIHSLRAGGEKGRHRVSFVGQEEEFVIEHRVFDRGVFARGALLAAHFLIGKEPGLYSMKDVWSLGIASD